MPRMKEDGMIFFIFFSGGVSGWRDKLGVDGSGKRWLFLEAAKDADLHPPPDKRAYLLYRISPQSVEMVSSQNNYC